MNRTARLNPISAKKRAKLAAAGITHPSNTFASPDKPAKPARRNGAKPADTGPDDATVELVLERDNWSCVVCGDGLHGRRGREWSIHHRLLKSQGVDNRPANLISVCGNGCTSCHGDLHGGPNAARKGGWIVLSTDEPETKPVAHSQHGWVLLNNEGSWTKTEPPHDPMEAAMPAGKEF